jgi:ADP-ribose pyrophosphatase
MIPKRLARETVYENEWVSLYLDKVQFSENHIIDKMHFVHYDKEAVGIVVLNENDEVLLIKAHRYFTQSEEWEIPAGCIDQGESSFDAATRETMEETGYSIQPPEKIYRYNPTNGSSNQVFHIYKAYATEKTGDFDLNEVSEIKWVKKEEILNMLKRNEINCGFSLVGLMLVLFCGL